MHSSYTDKIMVQALCYEETNALIFYLIFLINVMNK